MNEGQEFNLRRIAMIYLDKAWKDLLLVIERQSKECLALYENFIHKSSELELIKDVFLTPVLAGMSEAEQSELKDLLKQDNFMDFIVWR